MSKPMHSTERPYQTTSRDDERLQRVEAATAKARRSQHLVERAGRKPIASNGRRKDMAAAAQLRAEARSLLRGDAQVL